VNINEDLINIFVYIYIMINDLNNMIIIIMLTFINEIINIIRLGRWSVIENTRVCLFALISILASRIVRESHLSVGRQEIC